MDKVATGLADLELVIITEQVGSKWMVDSEQM